MKKGWRSKLSQGSGVTFVTLFLATLAPALAQEAPGPSTSAPGAPDVTSFDPLTATAEPDKTLSFYFQNIEVRSLLQLIAKNSDLNFIISDAVKGSVTLNLKNVTWRQALDVVLRTQGLTSRRIGSALYISTIEDITTTESKQLESSETLSNLAPLKSVLVRLRYANATDVAALLKGSSSSLLSARGQIGVDPRTNSIIIRDIPKSITSILPEIHKLDIPAKQVLIEARIVNIDTTYEEELGVRFGMSDTRHLSGTLSGANQLAQGVDASNVTPFTDRLNFNVPAIALFDGARPGSLGLALGRIGPIMIDLELSALEGERHAQVIARPRVVTSNQQKAVIKTGEEIPYQESTSSGATSVVFKNAVLSLEIVPQITPNNKVVLALKVTQDTRGENIAVGTTGINNVPTTIPAINTQSVESIVLLNNNETIVLGGVYRLIKQNSMDRIPFFGQLPMVGNLFTHRGIHNEKRELLIFITPKIIHSVVNGAPTRYRTLSLKGEG